VLVGSRDDVRLVLLDGNKDLIAARMNARKDHFMPPSLLASQFATLERPASEERALIVPVDGTPQEIAADIVRRLSA